MTRTATVEDLDLELVTQAAVSQRAIADQQAQLHASHLRVQALQADLATLREELRRARTELHWLRRAGIDLNRMMEHPAARAARAVGRGARTVLRVIRRRGAA